MLQATKNSIPQIQISKTRSCFLEGFYLYYLILIGSTEGIQNACIFKLPDKESKLNMLVVFHKPTGSTEDTTRQNLFQN